MSSKNRQVKNGMYIATTKSSFTGKTFDLEKDKLKKCEIKGQDTNKDIWILFLPESSNVYGILKIKSLVIKVDI